MNQHQEKVDIYAQIFPDYVLNTTHNNEIYCFCPQCDHHKRKLVISLEKDIFHCWVCDFSGHVSKLIKIYGNEILWREWRRINGQEAIDYDLRDLLSPEKIQVEEKKRIKLPIESKRLIGSKSIIANKAIQFLSQRNITPKIIRMFNFYFCEEGKYRDRIIIPSYDLSGKMNFFIARSIYNAPDILKYVYPTEQKENIIFNELFVTWERPVVLVEGVFDAIAVNYNAIPILGNKLAETSAIFRKILHYKPEVILMLDNDEAGKEGSLKLSKLLLEWGVSATVASYSAKDPGELKRKEVLEAIKNRKKLTESDLLRRILE